MRILHVIPYCGVPPKFGGALRIHNIMKQMLRWNDVSVIFIGSEQKIPELRSAMGGRLGSVTAIPRHWSRNVKRAAQLYSLFSDSSYTAILARNGLVRRAVRDEIAKGSYDLIMAEFPLMTRYDPAPGIVSVLDAHNVEYDTFHRIWRKSRGVFRRLYYYDQYRKTYQEEMEAVRRQDAVIVTSERDKRIFDTDAPDVRKFVIPNGVDGTYFTPNGEPPEPASIIFTGSMRYVPNSDGALWFIDEILPAVRRSVPDVRLYVVGDSPPPSLVRRRSDRILVTGYVDDVRPHIRRAALSIVPLRMGGGSRLKIVESLAMKKPVVTTTIGSEGIDLVHGESALIADDPATFAESVVSLLKDPPLRGRLAGAGFELMKSRYEWSVIGEQLNEVLHRLVRPASAGGSGADAYAPGVHHG